MKRKVCYRQSLVAAIETFLPAQFFAQWSLRQGLAWTPRRLVWLVLLMTWAADQTLVERFEATCDWLRALFPRWLLGTTYTGYSAALEGWSATLQPAVSARLRRQMQGLPDRHWLREGWCAFACDGSRVDCPRTAANQAKLGCAGKKRTTPQLFLTTLWHMGLGLPWDYRVGPGTASERRHLQAMLADLPPQSLVVADAGFVGYDLCRRLLAARHSFLLRVGANVQLLQGLGYAEVEGGDTVYLWPERCQRDEQEPLVLRLLVLPAGKKKVYLLTDVLDQRRLSLGSAATLYRMRWGVEVFYRSCKQTLQRRKMLSRAPGQAQRELEWAVLGIWLLGLLSVAAIVGRGGDPLSWSVALARRWVRQALRRCLKGECGPQTLQEQLATATQDGYQRHGSKQARDWPHKKRQKPPGEPQVAQATAQQRERAQEVKAQKEAKAAAQQGRGGATAGAANKRVPGATQADGDKKFETKSAAA